MLLPWDLERVLKRRKLYLPMLIEDVDVGILKGPAVPRREFGDVVGGIEAGGLDRGYMSDRAHGWTSSWD
jgi:hypothetical protein